jgi:hypothetical protein
MCRGCEKREIAWPRPRPPSALRSTIRAEHNGEGVKRRVRGQVLPSYTAASTRFDELANVVALAPRSAVLTRHQSRLDASAADPNGQKLVRRELRTKLQALPPQTSELCLPLRAMP